MARPSNPPSQLSAAPSNGCLPQFDGMQFSFMLQVSRLAANAITGRYPDINIITIDRTNREQHGSIILAHLSAIMYSYWNAAPAGPSVFDLAAQHLPLHFSHAFREHCAAWGSQRLNASVFENLYVVEDGDHGSIIADYAMTNFYRVLGIRISPASAMRLRRIKLPAAARLTALPFHGVLVHDGIVSPCPDSGLTPEKKNLLLSRCRAAKAAGRIITGFHVQPPTEKAPILLNEIEDMSSRELSHFVRKRGGSLSDCSDRSALVLRALSVSHKPKQRKRASQHQLNEQQQALVARLHKLRKVKGLTIFRRKGYTKASNPHNEVIVMHGACRIGTFLSKELVPTVTEILNNLLKTAESKGSVFTTIAVDDKNTAESLNLITEKAGILSGFWPPPSIEEQACSIMMWLNNMK